MSKKKSFKATPGINSTNSIILKTLHVTVQKIPSLNEMDMQHLKVDLELACQHYKQGFNAVRYKPTLLVWGCFSWFGLAQK